MNMAKVKVDRQTRYATRYAKPKKGGTMSIVIARIADELTHT